MRLKSSKSRTFLKVLQVATLVGSLRAGPAYALRSPNLVGCEAMLSHAQSAAGLENALGTLETLAGGLDPKAREFRDVQLVRQQATPARDAQVVTMVFRGEQVREGLRLYSDAKATLDANFRSYAGNRTLRQKLVGRVLAAATFAATAFGVVHGTGVLAHEGLGAFTHAAGVWAVVSTPPSFIVAFGMLAHAFVKLASFEPMPGQLQAHLNQLLDGKLNGIYRRPEFIATHATVVSELFGAGLTNSTRDEAYRRATNTYLEDILDIWRTCKSPDQVVKEFEQTRKAAVSHLLYFDQERQEPVWIYVLRVTRKRPAGPRSPRKGKEFLKPAAPAGWPTGA